MQSLVWFKGDAIACVQLGKRLHIVCLNSGPPSHLPLEPLRHRRPPQRGFSLAIFPAAMSPYGRQSTKPVGVQDIATALGFKRLPAEPAPAYGGTPSILPSDAVTEDQVVRGEAFLQSTVMDTLEGAAREIAKIDETLALLCADHEAYPVNTTPAATMGDGAQSPNAWDDEATQGTLTGPKLRPHRTTRSSAKDISINMCTQHPRPQTTDHSF